MTPKLINAGLGRAAFRNRFLASSPWEVALRRSRRPLPQRGISRRQMLRTTGAAGAVLLSGLPGRALAGKAASGIPTPIPSSFFFPGRVDGSLAPTDPTGTHAGR